MAILSIIMDLPGEIGMVPRRGKMVTTDSLATITTAGYLNSFTLQGQVIEPTDILDVIYLYNAQTNSGTYDQFVITMSNGIITMVPDVSAGNVLLPVVSGDFATFNGTLGQIKDSGYLPSNAAKTTVVMATGAVTANHIATYTDTAGTLGQDAATAINLGNIQAGNDTTKGQLLAYGGSSNGHIIINPIGNTGNTAITIQNAIYGQATVLTIPDVGAATGNFVMSGSASVQHITSGNLQVDAGSIISGLSAGGFNGTVQLFPTTTANGSLNLTAVNAGANFASTISNGTMGQATVYTLPDPGAATIFFSLSQSASVANAPKLIVRTITATAAALATAGHVAVQAHPSATSQFTIVDVKVMYAAAGLSGGGGDRLLSLTDGTIVFNQAGITAALLGTPVYTLWGGTGNPLPGSVSTISTAGADIYLVYAGGTTDYTTGQIVVQVTLAQVTA